jgi:hypothetical protein
VSFEEEEKKKQHGSRINHTKQHSSSKNKREIGITKAAASVEKIV